VFFQDVGVVGADDWVVFNDGDAAAHGESRAADYTRWESARKGGRATAIFLP
jgi:hypothetical protein